MCFESGDTELFVWNKDQKLIQRLDVDKTDEHEDQLTCCDIFEKERLYVTGDKEGLVKIWNFKKQLMREVKFVEPINSVCFLNENADIIVGHSGNLSLLNARDYGDRKLKVSQEELDEFQKTGKDLSEDHFRKKNEICTKNEKVIYKEWEELQIQDNMDAIKNKFQHQVKKKI